MKIKSLVSLSAVAMLFVGCVHKSQPENPKVVKEYVLPDEYNLIEKEFNKKLNSLVVLKKDKLEKNKQFIKKGEVVIDYKNHLMWEDDSNNTGKMDWYEAQSYCNNLKLNDYSDWKLPTINELKSIVDLSNSPVINPIFDNIENSYYWSSISYLNNSNHPWRLNFQDGNSYYGYDTDRYFVRCVRDDLVFKNFQDFKIYSSVKFFNKEKALNNQIFEIGTKKGRLDNILYSNEVFEDVEKVYNDLLNIYFNIYMKYLPPVQKPIFPPSPTLIKSQFETKEMFDKRISKAIQQRKEEISELEKEYLHNVKIRNIKIKILEPILLKKLSEFQKGAFQVIVGTFTFEDPRYDAEKQIMYVTLKSSRSNYNKRIAIRVPLKIAKSFFNDINNIKPIVSFNFTPNTITLETIKAKYNNILYVGNLTNKDYKSETIEVRIKDNDMDFNNTKQLNTYFINPVLKSVIILNQKKEIPNKVKKTKKIESKKEKKINNVIIQKKEIKKEKTIEKPFISNY